MNLWGIGLLLSRPQLWIISHNIKRREAMGDKGGKKNKEKDQKQKAEKEKQKSSNKFDKQPKRKP